MIFLIVLNAGKASSAGGGGTITGNGTANKVAKFTGATAIGDSSITDNGTTVTMSETLTPDANDGSALGTGALSWSDLFLASGAVINFDNGNVTLTHATDKLTLAAANGFFTNAINCSNFLDNGGIEMSFSTSAGVQLSLITFNSPIVLNSGDAINMTSATSIHLNSTTFINLDPTTDLQISGTPGFDTAGAGVNIDSAFFAGGGRLTFVKGILTNAA